MHVWELKRLRKTTLDECCYIARAINTDDTMSALQVIAIRKILLRNRLLERKVRVVYNLGRRLGKIL
jgi:hypothetical protein